MLSLRERVRELLPIGVNNEQLLDENRDGEVLLMQDTSINVTFLDDGACFENSLGVFYWPADIVPGKSPREYTAADRVAVLDRGSATVVFPNVDSIFCNMVVDDLCQNEDVLALCSSNDPFLELAITLPVGPRRFAAGLYLSFFLVPDGFANGLGKGPEPFKADAGQIHFSTPELNDPDILAAGEEPRLAVIRQAPDDVMDIVDATITYDFSDDVLVAFEDVRTDLESTNRDYQDTVMLISFQPVITVTDPPTQRPTIAPTLPPVLLRSATPTGAGSTAPSKPLCTFGIANACGDVCCAPGCGACGGCDVICTNLGSAEDCCPNSIRESGIPCILATDVACLLDSIGCPSLGC